MAEKKMDAPKQEPPKELTGLVYSSLIKYMIDNKWKKQKDDFTHAARPSTMRIEWWNRGADALLIVVEGANDANKATAYVFQEVSGDLTDRIKGNWFRSDNPSATMADAVMATIVARDGNK